jgi:hypothetical protein
MSCIHKTHNQNTVPENARLSSGVMGSSGWQPPQTHTLTANNNNIGAMNSYAYSHSTESLFINNS